MDTDFLIECWDRIKPFIDKKEKMEVADALVCAFDAHGYIDGIGAMADTLEGELCVAVKAHFDIDEEEENDVEY